MTARQVRHQLAEQAETARRAAIAEQRALLARHRELALHVAELDAVLAALGIERHTSALPASSLTPIEIPEFAAAGEGGGAP